MEREEYQYQLRRVSAALAEKGYCPVIQLMGYLLTEDPTYITNHDGARKAVSQMDRDELLQDMVTNFLDHG